MQKIFKITDTETPWPDPNRIEFNKIINEINGYYFIRSHGFSRIDNFPIFSIFLEDNFIRTMKLLKVTKQFDKIKRIETDVQNFNVKYGKYMVDIREII